MNGQVTFNGNCHRCGASILSVSLRDRSANLPTCDCKKETLNNMLMAILNVLERELFEPRFDEARGEIRDFLEEFSEDPTV